MQSGLLSKDFMKCDTCKSLPATNLFVVEHFGSPFYPLSYPVSPFILYYVLPLIKQCLNNWFHLVNYNIYNIYSIFYAGTSFIIKCPYLWMFNLQHQLCLTKVSNQSPTVHFLYIALVQMSSCRHLVFILVRSFLPSSLPVVCSGQLILILYIRDSLLCK